MLGDLFTVYEITCFFFFAGTHFVGSTFIIISYTESRDEAARFFDSGLWKPTTEPRNSNSKGRLAFIPLDKRM